MLLDIPHDLDLPLVRSVLVLQRGPFFAPRERMQDELQGRIPELTKEVRQFLVAERMLHVSMLRRAR